MPGHTYSGVVVYGAQDTPAAGATLTASRPDQHRTPLSLAMNIADNLVGDGPSQVPIGKAVADRKGRFILHTDMGYANKLEAVSADRRVVGSVAIHSRDASDLRVVLAPPNALFMHDGDLDPNSPECKAATAAMNQIVAYAATHPREPLLSLEGYAAHGVISQAAVDNFTQHSKLFFRAKPPIQFIMGERLIQMRDTHQPLTLQGNDELLSFRRATRS